MKYIRILKNISKNILYAEYSMKSYDLFAKSVEGMIFYAV